MDLVTVLSRRVTSIELALKARQPSPARVAGYWLVAGAIPPALPVRVSWHPIPPTRTTQPDPHDHEQSPPPG